MGSRQLESESSFSLRLTFDDVLGQSYWTIGKPVTKIHDLESVGLVLGIPAPHAIIPMSTVLPERGLVSLPFKKVRSLHLFVRDSTFLEFSFIRDHMELMVYYDQPPPPPSLLHALPLFDALRVLDIRCNDRSFLAGRTFHKLERCRLLTVDRSMHLPSEHVLPKTGMPVCTRVDIDDLWIFAAFILPQIHELALDVSESNWSVIWEKHIAANVNLSGLNLLHLKSWPHNGDLIPILRSVPLIETLIITTPSNVDSFSAFLPMDANGTSRLKRTRTTFAVLCPRLWHLQIESDYIWGRPDKVPFAKDIITLRAECGSPLKIFTVSQFHWSENIKFELIGRDGSSNMEKIVLPKTARPFALGI